MKFKRILATAFALALTLPLLAVSAHPGRTDSGGGHTDSDTGDYHYHHGYPAHEHYDVDNNGQIDCPYDFDDKTGENSGHSVTHSSDGDRNLDVNWAGTVPSDTTHKTFSRLDWILGITSSSPDPESTVAARPNEPPQNISSFKSTAWDTFCNLVGDEGTARLIAISTIALLISAPTYYFSNKLHFERLSRIAAPVAFVSALIPGFIAAYILFGILAVLSVLALLCFVLRGAGVWVRELFSRKEVSPQPSESKVATIDPQSLPPQTFAKPDPDVDFRPVILPESEVSAHTRCRDTCRYLWYETLMLRNCTKPLISSDATVYIWTALFYTAVKTLRSQSSVNRIYSYFSETTSEFVTEAQYTDLVVAKVREVYRELREPLNDSGIDPRTANGRRDLWRFLEDHSKELNFRPDLAHEFLCASQRVWEMIKDVFPQAHPYPKAGDIRYSIDDLPSA